MSLIDLWKTNPDQIEQYAIDQITAIAGGGGNPKDGSSCAKDFLENLNVSEKNGKLHHWHIHIEQDADDNPTLIVHKTGERMAIN